MTSDTTKAPEGSLGPSADADTHRALPLTVLNGLAEVALLADELINRGGLVNRGVERGLVVVEKADRSDPHYRLCGALERLEVARQQYAARDDTQPGTEKPSGFGVDTRERIEAVADDLRVISLGLAGKSKTDAVSAEIFRQALELEAILGVNNENHEALREKVARTEEIASWFAEGDPGAEGSVLLSSSVASEIATDLRAILAVLQSKRGEP